MSNTIDRMLNDLWQKMYHDVISSFDNMTYEFAMSNFHDRVLMNMSNSAAQYSSNRHKLQNLYQRALSAAYETNDEKNIVLIFNAYLLAMAKSFDLSEDPINHLDIIMKNPISFNEYQFLNQFRQLYISEEYLNLNLFFNQYHITAFGYDIIEEHKIWFILRLRETSTSLSTYFGYTSDELKEVFPSVWRRGLSILLDVKFAQISLLIVASIIAALAGVEEGIKGLSIPVLTLIAFIVYDFYFLFERTGQTGGMSSLSLMVVNKEALLLSYFESVKRTFFRFIFIGLFVVTMVNLDDSEIFGVIGFIYIIGILLSLIFNRRAPWDNASMTYVINLKANVLKPKEKLLSKNTEIPVRSNKVFSNSPNSIALSDASEEAVIPENLEYQLPITSIVCIDCNNENKHGGDYCIYCNYSIH